MVDFISRMDNDLLASLVSSLPAYKSEIDQSIPLSIHDSSNESNGTKTLSVTDKLSAEVNRSEALLYHSY